MSVTCTGMRAVLYVCHAYQWSDKGRDERAVQVPIEPMSKYARQDSVKGFVVL